MKENITLFLFGTMACLCVYLLIGGQGVQTVITAFNNSPLSPLYMMHLFQ